MGVSYPETPMPTHTHIYMRQERNGAHACNNVWHPRIATEDWIGKGHTRADRIHWKHGLVREVYPIVDGPILTGDRTLT